MLIEFERVGTRLNKGGQDWEDVVRKMFVDPAEIAVVGTSDGFDDRSCLTLRSGAVFPIVGAIDDVVAVVGEHVRIETVEIRGSVTPIPSETEAEQGEVGEQ